MAHQPIPNAAYIVAGELTLERKKDGEKQRFTAGQGVAETVVTFHSGIAGEGPVVLIVFYAGSHEIKDLNPKIRPLTSDR